MNERFFALDEGKRNAIINAGFSIFSRYDFKHGSMDMIAQSAGVSKALLFHYFETKRGLYLFLWNYALDYVIERLAGELYADGETDFFALVARGQSLKLAIRAEHPDLMQFLVNGYLENSEDVSPDVAKRLYRIMDETSEGFSKRVDAKRFKDGIDVDRVARMVMWFGDGFMRAQPPEALDDLNALNDEFMAYLELMRRHFYKEEYL